MFTRSPVFEETYKKYLKQIAGIEFKPLEEKLGVKTEKDDVIIPFFGKSYMVSGKGIVYSWVTYHESPHPAFKAPYSVVLVELEEGMRIVSNLVDVTPDEIEIGMEVSVVFDAVTEEMTLPKFKKIKM